MEALIGLIVTIIVIVLILAAVLAVARAILALPPMAGLQPYNNLIYSLIVLLCVLLAVQWFLGGWPMPHRFRG